MALDHVRDTFSNAHGSHSLATDMARTWPALFFSRWVTHFCAPVFVFLAGTSARLQVARGVSTRSLSRFLLIRGAWIVVLELTVIHVVMTMDLGWHWILLQVMWAIGCSMIALAGLVRLPTWLVTAIGVALCAGHNLLPFPPHSGPAVPWRILEAGGDVPLDETHKFVFGYPLLAWIGVMAVGYGFGALVRWEPARRRRAFLLLGGSLTLLFVGFRAVNGYGDPARWAVQKNALFTLMSFLNTTKYPPSLDFLLMTLGPALLALGWLDRLHVGPANPVVVFGRVPMFFYALHFAARDLLGLVVYSIQTGKLVLDPRGPQLPPDAGFTLPGVYAFWVLVVVALYWPCKRFSEYKRAHPEQRWLSYV